MIANKSPNIPHTNIFRIFNRFITTSVGPTYKKRLKKHFCELVNLLYLFRKLKRTSAYLQNPRKIISSIVL